MAKRNWTLFLDDVRDPPASLYIYNVLVARSSAEAIEMIKKYGLPVRMSLDHDLGETDTGMKFLHALEEYVYENKITVLPPPGRVVYHSSNPPGRANMRSYYESMYENYCE